MLYNVPDPPFILIRWKCLCISVYNVLVMFDIVMLRTLLMEEIHENQSANKFEERYLRKGFDSQISMVHILDSRRDADYVDDDEDYQYVKYEDNVIFHWRVRL